MISGFPERYRASMTLNTCSRAYSVCRSIPKSSRISKGYRIRSEMYAFFSSLWNPPIELRTVDRLIIQAGIDCSISLLAMQAAPYPYLNPEHPEVAGYLPPSLLITSKCDNLRSYSYNMAAAIKRNGSTCRLKDYGSKNTLITRRTSSTADGSKSMCIF